MPHCKDCHYWHASDVTKPHSWGDCYFYMENSNALVIPIFLEQSDCAPLLLGRTLGYTSPTQANCKTFLNKT